MIILTDHLQYVTDNKVDSGLLTWNQLITDWVVLEQRSDEYLTQPHTALLTDKTDVWLHGVVVNMSVSINVVAPHQARLLLGWVTVC